MRGLAISLICLAAVNGQEITEVAEELPMLDLPIATDKGQSRAKFDPKAESREAAKGTKTIKKETKVDSKPSGTIEDLEKKLQ